MLRHVSDTIFILTSFTLFAVCVVRWADDEYDCIYTISAIAPSKTTLNWRILLMPLEFASVIADKLRIAHEKCNVLLTICLKNYFHFYWLVNVLCANDSDWDFYDGNITLFCFIGNQSNQVWQAREIRFFSLSFEITGTFQFSIQSCHPIMMQLLLI